MIIGHPFFPTLVSQFYPPVLWVSGMTTIWSLAHWAKSLSNHLSHDNPKLATKICKHKSMGFQWENGVVGQTQVDIKSKEYSVLLGMLICYYERDIVTVTVTPNPNQTYPNMVCAQHCMVCVQDGEWWHAKGKPMVTCVFGWWVWYVRQVSHCTNKGKRY